MDEYQDVLERTYAGRLKEIDDLYIEIPTLLFVGRVDIKMPPLPKISFFERKLDGSVTKIRDKNDAYSSLALSQYQTVLVEKQEYPTLHGFAEAQILAASRANNLPVEQRVESLRRAAILVVEDLFNHPTPENINRSQKIVGSFVHLLMKDPQAYLMLARLSSHDPYTLQHSVGCAVNSIILARKVGINDPFSLNEVGMAGLLHDIGKVKISKDIINKPGPLDDEEWVQMRQHSTFGYEIIKDHPSLSERTKLAVLEHHEDREGKGYPEGKPWNRVDMYSKIVCIADIFNALTTNRSYALARKPFDALKLMKDKMTNKLDEDLFKHLVLIYGGFIDDL